MVVYVKQVFAYEGNVYHYRDGDGYPAGIPVPNIAAFDYEGNEYALPNITKKEYDEDGFGPYIRFLFDLEKARDIAEAAMTRGYINEEHWVEVPAVDEPEPYDYFYDDE